MTSALSRANLVALVAAPTVWALHFLVCYVSASVACAKTMPDARVFTGAGWPDIPAARMTILVATLLALALIGWSSLNAWGHWGADAEPPHDEATFEDRRRFLGLSTLLLCGLSAIGVVFVALPALFIGDCR